MKVFLRLNIQMKKFKPSKYYPYSGEQSNNIKGKYMNVVQIQQISDKLLLSKTMFHEVIKTEFQMLQGFGLETPQFVYIFPKYMQIAGIFSISYTQEGYMTHK